MFLTVLGLIFLCGLRIPPLYSRGTSSNPEKKVDFSYTADLSPREKKWLEEHQSIRVGGPLQFIPFHFYNEQGQPQGITSDYIKILLGNLGLEIDNQQEQPWPDVLENIKNRDLDVIACLAKSSEREKFMNFTDPLLSFPMVIFSRFDVPFISGTEDIFGLKLAVVKGTIIHEWMEGKDFHSQPVLVSTPGEALKAVSLGEADICIDNIASGSYRTQNLGLTNIKVAAPAEDFGNYDLYIAVRTDWPELVSILNKSLTALSQEQHMAIRNRWLSIRYDYGISVYDIIKYVTLVLIAAGLIILMISIWNRKLKREIEVRKAAENELQEALDNIKTLSGLLPICSSCNSIRDDKGYWKRIEEYFSNHSSILFSHSLCPKCYEELYGKEKWYTPLSEKEEEPSKEKDKKTGDDEVD